MSRTESSILNFYAHHYTDRHDDRLIELMHNAITALDHCSTSDWKERGAIILVINIAALLQYGDPENKLWQLFVNTVNDDIQSTSPPVAADCNALQTSSTRPTRGTRASAEAYRIFFSTFRALIDRVLTLSSLRKTHLQKVETILHHSRPLHVALVWMCSLHWLQRKVRDTDVHSILVGMPWAGLCEIFDLLYKQGCVKLRTLKSADEDALPGSGSSQPLPEDCDIRGLIWNHSYYPNGFFPADIHDVRDSCHTKSDIESRLTRIDRLVAFLAVHREHIKFDAKEARFRVCTPDVSPGAETT